MEFHKLEECGTSKIQEIERVRKVDEFRQLELRWEHLNRVEVANNVLNPTSFLEFYKKNKRS